MIALPAEARRLLCLGAHSDDIEIGCGGTIMKLTGQSSQLEVLWVVLSADGARVREARASAKAFLAKAARSEVVVRDFRGSFFPYQGEQIKEYFETLKAFGPDLVLTHYRDDRHQDHRVVSDLTWNTFRDHLILEYEVPKYDGDLGQPNVFVEMPEKLTRRKVKSLCRFFQSQSNKHWFTEEIFLGLMRLRGMECASPSGFAEAFYGRKLVLGRS
jgi:LmbE family N-acetylglucosaminyl deacetylase